MSGLPGSDPVNLPGLSTSSLEGQILIPDARVGIDPHQSRFSNLAAISATSRSALFAHCATISANGSGNSGSLQRS